MTWPTKRAEVRAIDVAGRVPPNDTAAERAVLSACLADRQAVEIVRGVLSSADFYQDAHRRIWLAVEALAEVGAPIDVQTIATYLKDRDYLTPIGGIAYLAKIVDATPAVAHVEAHARIVADKARVRAMIDACHAVVAEAYVGGEDAASLIERAEQRIFDVAHAGRATSDPEPVRSILGRAHSALLAQAAGERPARGLRTRLADLDRRLRLRFGSVTILAARPSVGKTTLALNLAANAATDLYDDHEIGVVVFSLETERDDLGTALLSTLSGVDLGEWVEGKAPPEASDAIAGGMVRGEPLPLWIEDAPNVSLLDIRARVRRIAASWESAPVRDGAGVVLRPGRKVGLVVVDYLQLVRPPEGVDPRHREQQIAAISRGLKLMAKELRIAVLCLSQLNRALEARQEKRPTLADLRESGSIEQDADNVVFLYRPWLYVKDRDTEEAQRTRRVAEAIIAKQRGGPIGVVTLRYTEETRRFE